MWVPDEKQLNIEFIINTLWEDMVRTHPQGMDDVVFVDYGGPITALNYLRRVVL